MAISRQEDRSRGSTLIKYIQGAQCHRQKYTLHAFEQFGTLLMHNFDAKHPTQSGFEPSTCHQQLKYGL